MDKKEKHEIEGVGIMVALAVIVLAWPQIVVFLGKLLAPFTGLVSKIDWRPLVTNFQGFVEFLIGFSVPVSVFFLIGIIYCVEQLKVVRKKEAMKHDVKVEPAYEEAAAGHPDLAARWTKVQDLMGSANQSDWKQAILVADTMLDDILGGLGYQGESIGEKLKRVGPGEMKAVNDAWDAHKVRNSIAHDGSFTITHHDANEAIQRYRRVFEEFYTI